MKASDLNRHHTGLSSDERAIDEVGFLFEGGGNYRVGEYGITQIVAYDEHGEMSMVPWLAIFVGDQIVARFPARHVIVKYAVPGL